MNAFSSFARQAVVAMGALSMTVALFLGSFSVDPTVTSLGGLVA